MKPVSVSPRIGGFVLAAIALIAVIVASQKSTTAYDPEVRAEKSLWMPSAPSGNSLTETWFCPGIPAPDAETGGSFRITNRLGDPASGTIVLYNEKSENTRIPLDIAAFSVQDIDVAQLPGEMTGAVVEVEGGGTLVQQVSSTPAGNSFANCANDTNTDWYFADGFTVDGSRDRIVLSNPYDQPVVVELTFAVADGSREQAAYRTMPIPERSIRVVDLGTAGGGAQDESLLAVTVSATRGQLVVGRVEDFASGGRAGTQVSVASPYLSDQWRFAGGRHEEGYIERYTIYNPTEDDVLVEPVVLGNPTVASPEEGATPLDLEGIEVGPGRVVEFVPTDFENFPEGNYSMVFSTLSDPSIVVERATTQTIGDKENTSVILGATAREPDLYLATQWLVPQAPEDALLEALVIHNLDLQDGDYTIFAIGPEGATPVPSITDVPLPNASEVLEVNLEAPELLGKPLVVQATNRIIVECWFRSGRGDTRTVVWALPAS